ncbi:hypothetical protein CesoFtcFv8_022181 [Champsocephalus esox]|nr:hypothetical protein CesoFtcFv8_022181 [Champsocephalus esox]
MRYVYFLRCSICSIRQGGYKARRISRESSLANEKPDEKAWPPPKSLPLPSVRAQPWKAGGHNIVEQISSNLSVLVLGSGGKAALWCPPRLSHRSAQFTLHSANTLQEQ